MPTSPRLNWPYPSEFAEHWWTQWVNFVTAVDASFYSTREDKNFVLFGGGYVSFNATTGVLSWTDAFQAVSAVTGNRWYIPAASASGSVTLQDGEFFYVLLTRAPTTAQSVAAIPGSRIPVSDDALVIAQRLGPAVLFRNGAVLGDGQTIQLLAPATFTNTLSAVGLTGLETTADTGWQDRGGLVFDPTKYFPGGLGITRDITFRAILWTTQAILPARVRLWNLTEGQPVAGTELSSTSLTPEAVVSASLTPGAGYLSSGEDNYLVQVRLDDSGGIPGLFDQIACIKAELLVIWT